MRQSLLHALPSRRAKGGGLYTFAGPAHTGSACALNAYSTDKASEPRSLRPLPATACALPLLVAILLAGLLTGCAETMTAAAPARKWVGPLVAVPGGGQFRTVIYYGPWQCRRDFMESCKAQCAGSGHVLMGCMWLADVKMDFEGTVLQTGSRFAVTHCCCNYAPKTTAQTATLRQRWDAIRESFRKDWAKRFGEWPTDSQGNAWPCHHLRDLKHGGSPTDWENLFPLPPEIHSTLGGLYNQCYAGNGPWSSAGPDYPYGE